MTLREMLLSGVKVLVCRFSDNSEVKFLCTLNREELELRGLSADGTLYDLESLKPIPRFYLENIYTVEDLNPTQPSGIYYNSKLDEYLSKGLKWDGGVVWKI